MEKYIASENEHSEHGDRANGSGVRNLMLSSAELAGGRTYDTESDHLTGNNETVDFVAHVVLNHSANEKERETYSFGRFDLFGSQSHLSFHLDEETGSLNACDSSAVRHHVPDSSTTDPSSISSEEENVAGKNNNGKQHRRTNRLRYMKCESCWWANHYTQYDDSTCLQTWTTWVPCTFAKMLGKSIYDKHNGDFTRLDLVLCVASIILYLVDIGSDVRLAVEYFQDGEWIYGGLTTAFIVVAYIALLIAGLWVYREHEVRQSRLWWICKLFFVIFALTPVIATLECVYYGWRGRTRERDRNLYNASTSAFLRLLESFLESAPQLCFQLYVVFKGDDDNSAGVYSVLQRVVIFSSWASLALSAIMYRKHISGDEVKSTIPGQIIYFLWRVCETGGRVLCIALFASTFEFWVFAVLGPHFLVMFLWNVWARGGISNEESLHGVGFGYIMLFLMPFHTHPSRYPYFVYYVIFYAENFLLLGVWAGMTSDRDAWFYMPGIVTVIVFFILHIVMLFLYYKVAHPNAKTIKCWEKWDWERVSKSLSFSFQAAAFRSQLPKRSRRSIQYSASFKRCLETHLFSTDY